MKRKKGLAWLLTLMLCLPLGGNGSAETAEEAPGEVSETLLQENGEEAGTVSPAAAQPSEYQVLRKGAKGEAVQRLQARLTELGYEPGEADGIFGNTTREAVKNFQKRNGLEADGAAGVLTQTALYSPEALGPLPPAEPVDVMAGEWPMLTNLEHPVGEDFVPADLVKMVEICPEDLIKIKYPETMAVREAAEALVKMLEAAKADGISKWQCSAAYRSYADQEKLLNNRINTYLRRNESWSRGRARRAALQTVAEPGASEHHLGLAFDINVPGTSSFAGTRQCSWLHANCWEYGFVVRYPEGKKEITGFTPEPWHIRYVGNEHARIMWEEDLCLEEYLERYQPKTEEMEAGESPDASNHE